LLDDIHAQRDQARQARSSADKAHLEAEKLRNELSRRLDQIEEERRLVLEKARSEADVQVQELQEEVRQARRLLVKARQPLDVLQSVEEKVSELEESVEKPVERRAPQLDEPSAFRALRLGDKVLLRSLNTQGVITSLGEEEADVQVGMLHPCQVCRYQTSMPRLLSQSQSNFRKRTHPLSASPRLLDLSHEIDLRGQRSDDALDILSNYLDSAFLAGMPFVRIIHGKGTGKLRLSVREMLSQHPHVKSFEAGSEKEGGDGVQWSCTLSFNRGAKENGKVQASRHSILLTVFLLLAMSKPIACCTYSPTAYSACFPGS
jgi:DNA mismatch repair protein MutS2